MDLTKPLDQAKAKDINSYCDSQGQSFAKNIKTNQIRNVFSRITSLRNSYKSKKKYDEELERALILLKPQLAYAAGRNRDVLDFKNEMNKVIDSVIVSTNKELAIENFFAVIEGFVAYHKFYSKEKS